ncbi:MAG: Wzz/FepE/Etk N-terminal domain-containing protein [Thermoanaerobacterales bacterium]|nr:Wzz/FepE/Etk N-terminal domain-containing protein [Thermoanaerobacterales bacterium]
MDSDNSKNTSPSPEYYDDEIDLRDLILVLWNYRKFVLGIFLASLLIGAVISFAITPVYQVKAKISLGNYAVDPDNGQPLMTPETAREILLSSDFQEEAWGHENNAGALNIAPVENTNILQFTLETSEPQRGVVLLNKLIAQFEEKTKEQYERSIELLNKDLQNTDGELQEINKSIAHTREILENTSASQLQQAGLLDTLSRFLEQRDKLSERKLKTEQKLNSIEGMEVLERPEAASSPMRPNKKLNIVVAGMLGLMVGVFMAFIVDYFRRKPLNIQGE